MGGNKRPYGRTAALLVSFYVAVLLFGPAQAQRGEGFFKDLYCSVGFFSGASCDIDYSKISMIMEETATPAPSVLSEQVTVQQEQPQVTNLQNIHPVTVVYKPAPVYEFVGNTDFYTPTPSLSEEAKEWTPLALFYKQIDKIYDLLGDRVDDAVDDLEDDLSEAFTTLSLTLTGALYDYSNSAGLSGNVLVSTGSGVVWTATSSLGIVSGGGGGLASTDIDTSAELIAIVTNETGSGRLVFSNTPAFSGTATFSALTATSTLTMSGTAANIALGSNFLSGDGGDEGVFVSSAGNVSIGSSSPTAKLEVLQTNGDTESDGFKIARTNNASGRIYMNSGNDFVLQRATRTNQLVLDNSGNVGIGTSTPSQKFTVDGSSLFTDTLYLGSTTESIQFDPGFIGMYATGGADPFIEFYTDTNGMQLLSDRTIFELRLVGSNGSEAAPAYSFSGDSSSGMFYNVSTGLGISTYGVDRLHITNGGNVGIGTSTPSQELTVSGDLRLTGAIYDSNNSAGTSGFVLQSTATGQRWVATSTLGFGTGNLSEADIDTSAELLAIVTNETGTGNLVFSASPTFTGTISAAAGTFSSTLTAPTFNASGASTTILSVDNISFFRASTTNTSVFMGENAGISVTSDGPGNTGFGHQALKAVTEGASNTAIGLNSLLSNITGSMNTAVGASTLVLSMGSFNNAFGAQALQSNTVGSYNSAFGDAALFANTSGSHNVAIGRQTLLANNGTGTIAIGYQAGNNLTSGDRNILIGYDIDAPTATSDNILNIGNLLFGTGIDGTGTTLSSGNIGIGTTTPGAKLTIHAANGETNSKLFVIASSTASATADLFSVSNTGETLINSSFMSLHNSSGASYLDISGVGDVNSYSNLTFGSTVGGPYWFMSHRTGGAFGLYYTSDDITYHNPLMVEPETPTGTLYLDSTGNIGVGTTTPNSKLSVVGTAGSAEAVFSVASSSGSTSFTVLENGYVGIGRNNPQGPLHVTGTSDIFFDRYSSASTDQALDFLIRRGRGSLTTPTTVVADDVIFKFVASAYNGSSHRTAAQIMAEVDGEPNTAGDTTDMPGRLTFYTTPDGASTAVERLRIDQAGNVGVNTNAPDDLFEVRDGNLRITNNTNPARLTLWGDTGNNGDTGVNDARIAIRMDNADTVGWNIDAFNYASSVSTMQFNHVDGAVNVLTLGDGTTAGVGNVGIGTTTPSSKLHVYGTFRVATSSATTTFYVNTGNNRVGINTIAPEEMFSVHNGNIKLTDSQNQARKITLQRNGVSLGQITTENSQFTLKSLSNTDLMISEDSGVGILLRDGGNVGIGDTSPDDLLNIHSASAAAQLAITSLGTDTDPTLGFQLADGTNTFTIGIDDSDSDKFKISGSALGTNDRFVIDSSGNVGIGTSTPASKFTVSGGDVLIDNGEYYQAKRNTSGTAINVLGFESGTDNLYLRTGGASVSNRFSIVNTGSTEMFTVLNSGLVGIGTSTPDAKLEVVGNGSSLALELNNTSTGDGLRINTANATANNGLLWYQGADNLFNVFSNSSNEGFMALYDAGVTAVQLASNGNSFFNGGNLGIGTSTPVARTSIVNSSGITLQLDKSTGAALQFSRAGVYGYQIDDSAGTMRWLSSGTTERMRLDSAGSLGINTTAFGASNNNGAAFIPYAGGIVQEIGHNGTAADGDLYINFRRLGVSLGSIAQVSSTGVVYNTTSDRRVKENIDTTKLSLANLMQLPVREFSFIADETHATTTGFIAQELYRVFPWAVTTNGDDGIDPLTGSSDPWSVDYGRVTPLLVKSIQDLNLDLQALLIGNPSASSTFAFLLEEENSVWNKLTTIAQGFVDGVLTLAGVTTDELCLRDEQGSTCIDREELEALIYGANAQSSSNTDTEAEDEEDTEEETEEQTSTSTPEVTEEVVIGDTETDLGGEEEVIDDGSEDPQEQTEVAEGAEEDLESIE